MQQNSNNFKIQVFVKPTNLEQCLNGSGECPNKYQNSVGSTFVRRVLTHCSSWTNTHQEFELASQCLVNNGYSNRHINKSIKTTLEKWYSEPANQPTAEGNIKLYYRAYMTTKYKENERIMKNIVCNNVSPRDNEKKIKLITYYKNCKTKNLLMKNHPRPNEDPLKNRMVLYRFLCPTQRCLGTYIGMTTMRLRESHAMHKKGRYISTSSTSIE